MIPIRRMDLRQANRITFRRDPKYDGLLSGVVVRGHCPFKTHEWDLTNDLCGSVQTLGKGFILLGRPFTENVLNLLSLRVFVTDPEAKAREVRTPEPFDDVGQPVVPTGTSLGL